MTSLHTFITRTLGERVRGVDAPADLRDLREGAIIDLVSDLRERRDGVAREIDPRVVAGLIQFEQLRQNEEVARLRQEIQSLREVNARLLGAAPAGEQQTEEARRHAAAAHMLRETRQENQELREVNARLQELQSTLDASVRRRNQALSAIGDDLDRWIACVRRGRSRS